MTSGECSYTHDMTSVLADGMSFVVNNWAGNDEWFRNDRCATSCSVTPDETVGNITIT